MRSRTLQHGASGAVGRINVTPMIDVVMCLIVFFLIVGSLAAAKLERVELAPSDAGDAVRGEPLIVNIVAVRSGTGDVSRVRASVLGREVSAGDVASLVSGERVVRIRSDRAAPYETVRAFARACRSAGAESIEFAVAPGER